MFNYVRQFFTLSRNAKLYLVYACFAGGIIPGGLVFGIWTTVFNLYLLELGYSPDFVGTFQRMEWIGHALLVIPFGLLADLIGRRSTFIYATLIGVVASSLLLITVNPTWLLFLSFWVGAGRGAHGVAGAPFMAENSQPLERPFLFSFAQVLSMVMFMIGSLIGGYLPPFLGGGKPNPSTFILTLSIAIPLLVIALIPIYKVEERFQRVRIRDLAKNIQSYTIIGLLVITTGLTSIGLGFVLPLFNIFFAGRFGANVTDVGTIFAIGGVAGLLGSALAPALSRRWGKVNTILFGSMVSAGFLVMMVLSPLLWMSGGSFMFRNLFFSIAQPIRALFAMEVVHPRERASTEGMTHFMFDLPVGFTVGLSGEMMFRQNFYGPFVIASIFTVIAALVYFLSFRRFEKSAVMEG